MNIISSDISFKSNMSIGNYPDSIVLHHAEASVCTVQDIDRWHKDRGWAGIGYHYFVRKNGVIYTGRPENVIGAHCPPVNSHSIGICAEGEYMSETMPVDQKNSIVELCKMLKAKYPAIKNIYGHKELMSTACPGNNYPLNEIKNLINAKVVVEKDIPIINRNWLQVGDKGDKVVYLQKSLIAMGFDLGASGADGDYGKITKNAVFNFQQAIKIDVDGLAGVETFKAIDEIMKTPLDGIKSQHYEYATRFIQYKTHCNVNGLFNYETAEYVKTYQRKNNLFDDGIVGPRTWGKLLKV